VLTEGPLDIWVLANKSLLLTMALHELATNAVKYGSLSNTKGQVSVRWQRVGSQRGFKLSWEESGGPPVTAPEKKGFGSFLIERALKDEVDRASFEFQPQGLICTFEVTL
jgi:two-component sensor histidine kinase